MRVFAAERSFSDIKDLFAKDAILELSELGIIQGNGDGYFDPKGKMNRAQFAKILVLSLKLELTKEPEVPTYKDVPPSHWAFIYVKTAAKAQIFNGYSDRYLKLC